MSRFLDYDRPCNVDHPLMRGVVSRWQVLDQNPWWGGKSFLDTVPIFSGRGGKHGTLTGGPTWAGAMGRKGGFGSLDFVLASSQTVIASGVSWPANPGPISVAFWIKTAGGLEASSWGIGDTAVTDARIQSHTPWSDDVLYWDYGNHTIGRVSTPFSNYLGVWTHVVLVATGSSGAFQAIYLNGSLAASAANSAEPTVVRSTLRIGSGYSDVLRYSTNKQDDFALWNRVLSAAEVRQLYLSTSHPQDPTLNWIESRVWSIPAAADTYPHWSIRRTINQQRRRGKLAAA